MPEPDDPRHELFLRLFTTNEAALRAFVRSLVPARADANDVMQEVALVLWRRFGECPTGEDFRHWAFGVARFKVLAWRRDHGRDRHVFGDDLTTALAEEAAERADGLEAQREVLRTCLEKLPDDQRGLVDAAYAPGARIDELAARCGQTAMALYKKLHRIRMTLIECTRRVMQAEGWGVNADDPRHEWMQQYADGIASAETVARLEAALCEDAEFRVLFLEYLNLDGALGAAAAAFPEQPREKVIAFPVSKRRPLVRWLAAAAAVVLAAVIGLKWIPVRDSQRVAVFARTVAVEWEDGAWRDGQPLAPGWLRLKAGVVQIEFSRGARVLLEGPAEFQLLSDNAGFLRRGRLRAHVLESARGFAIRAEGFSAVDHGTEFGCIVPETGAAEVHVLEGMVDVQPDGGAARVLAKAEAVRLSAGSMEAIPARAELFMSDEAFARIESASVGAKLAAWRQASAVRSAHPAALVHYDFEQARGSARTLPNRAPGLAAPADIIGCEPAQGRWPAKGALEFKHANDRLRFTVPGELQSLTLLAWVRVDGLPNTQSSLLMGESELPGEVHWYWHREAGVSFGVIAPDGRWRNLHTGEPLRRELFGTWLFLAVTFDGATGTATHYFNGQPVASQSFGQTGPLRLGTVEVGNWGVRPGATLRASRRVLNEPAGYLRNLHGRVDEFAILSTALFAEEIQRLYREGRADTAPPVSR